MVLPCSLLGLRTQGIPGITLCYEQQAEADTNLIKKFVASITFSWWIGRSIYHIVLGFPRPFYQSPKRNEHASECPRGRSKRRH